MIYSVVIPIYLQTEEQKKIALECLASVNKYKTEDTEIIIIDSGSKVNVSEFQNEDKYIKLEKSKGISGAWNEGIRASSGEYIAIINDDIVVYPDWLKHLRFGVNEDNAGASCLVMNSEGKTGINENYKWFSGSGFMLKRNVIDRIGFFDEQFYPHSFEDTDYWTRLIKSKYKLFQVCLGYTFHHEGKTVHSQDYGSVGETNRQKFIDKHGFDPIPYFNGNKYFEDNL